jgi:hypothetical protein
VFRAALKRAAKKGTFHRSLEAIRATNFSAGYLVLARQSAYRNWLYALRRPDPECSPLGYRHSFRPMRLPFDVHIIGLDSAWLAGDDHDAQQLRLTGDQILPLCAQEGGER